MSLDLAIRGGTVMTASDTAGTAWPDGGVFPCGLQT